MTGTTTATSTALHARKKILVILSGTDHVTLENGKEQKTGYFLPELATPLLKLLERGYEAVFANPNGSWPVQDPISSLLIWYLGNYKQRDREREVIEKMKVESNFAHPKRFAELGEKELDDFVGVFIPGGHAPMEDLKDDKQLGRILLHFHNRNKPTGAICHGPIALLSTLHSAPSFPYSSYTITAYSNTEDKLNETMWGSKLQYKIVDELQKAGAKIEDTIVPMGAKVSVDRELVTGQNPSSASSFGDAFVEKLKTAALAG